MTADLYLNGNYYKTIEVINSTMYHDEMAVETNHHMPVLGSDISSADVMYHRVTFQWCGTTTWDGIRKFELQDSNYAIGKKGLVRVEQTPANPDPLPSFSPVKKENIIPISRFEILDL